MHSGVWIESGGIWRLNNFGMLSIYFQTLGCKLNQLESESITGAFTNAGFELFKPSPGNYPSIVVINTCTVTSKADQKTRRIIRKTLRDFPISFVIVTGCYAQLNSEEICKLETGGSGRLFVLKGREKDSLAKLPVLLETSGGGFTGEIKGRLGAAIKTLCEAGEERSVFHFSPKHFSGSVSPQRTRAFLKIQDGCGKNCTYCAIRLARGPSISLPAQEALKRLKVLEENHSEVVLTGINICQYCDPPEIDNLGKLLDYLLAGTEKIALRLSSISPDSINEDIVKVFANNRVRPSFHLSIQSGCDKTLERMGRDYKAASIERAVDLLRSVKNDPFLACDIMAGFPGESEADYLETFELCQKIGFAWIHVFPYSKRRGTPAWSFTDTVQEKEVSRRVQLLTGLAWQGRAAYVRRWLGCEVDVLIEKSAAAKPCRGVSENYLKLLVRHDGTKNPKPGTVLRCLLPMEQEIIPGNDFDAVAVEIK